MSVSSTSTAGAPRESSSSAIRENDATDACSVMPSSVHAAASAARVVASSSAIEGAIAVAQPESSVTDATRATPSTVNGRPTGQPPSTS